VQNNGCIQSTSTTVNEDFKLTCSWKLELDLIRDSGGETEGNLPPFWNIGIFQRDSHWDHVNVLSV